MPSKLERALFLICMGTMRGKMYHCNKMDPLGDLPEIILICRERAVMWADYPQNSVSLFGRIWEIESSGSYFCN
jgi:hypothetical protein